MKKLFLLLFISFNSFYAMPQSTGVVGFDNGANGTFDYPCPIADFYYATRAQYLYTASELSVIGITPGSVISEIGWVVDATAIAGHLIEDYSISLLNTGVSSLSMQNWEPGTTLVYGPQTYSYSSGYAGQVIFPVSPFYYSGGNLIVEICGGLTSGGYTLNPSCRWSVGLPFSGSHQWRQDLAVGCGTTDSTNYAVELNRPVLVVTFTPGNLEVPTIEGDVYYDQNQNGLRDGGEIGLPNRFIELNPQGFFGVTNAAGHYKFYLDTSSYTVSWLPAVPWMLTSSPAVYSITLPPNSFNNDFGIWADSVEEFTQLVGYVAGTMRCNMTGTTQIHIHNSGIYPENGTVTLIHSANLPLNANFTTPGYTTNGDTVSWTYTNLLPGQNLLYQGVFNNGPAGDTVSFTFIDSVFSDSWIFKSVYSQSYTFIVTCSYDPNDKAVNPPGEYVEHYTLMNEELQYTIRFQNTGNDTAFNVRILDTLDANLDMSTLQIVANSHPVSLQMTTGGAMEFTFSNILLPDSIVDEPGSHGYVVYKIRPLAGLAEQTMIYNTAHIIFDFNAAVVTNTTYNNMVSQIPTGIAEHSLGSGGYIYPNPVTDQATVVLYGRTTGKHQLSVYNSIGKKLLSENFTGNQYQLKEKLPAGIYLVSVADEDGKLMYSSRLVKE